jgi:gliding motility-associated-like protein
VYNRYGSKVYENNNYRNEWKGTYNNKPLPDGTYYYTVTVQLITGRMYEVRGDVSIVR